MNSRPWLLPILALVFVFGLAWLAFSWFQGEASTMNIDRGTAADGGPVETLPGSVPRTTASRNSAAEPRVEHVDFVAEAPYLGELVEPRREGTLIRVVDADTREAVPDVDVFVSHEDIGFDWAMSLLKSTGDLMRDHSDRYRSDAEGLAYVRAPWSRAMATVMTGSRFGQVQVNSWVRDITLELRPMGSVMVRVIDAGGRPVVGAPVAWRRRVMGEEERPYQTILREFSRSPDGLVQLPLPGFIADGKSCHVAALDGLFAEEVETPFDPAQPPPAPLTLVMPPHGSVMIRAAPAAGAQVASGTYLARVARRRLTAAGKMEDVMKPSPPSILLHEGRGRIDFVGLGLELSCVVKGDSLAERRPIENIAAGPRREGEQVTIDLEYSGEPDKMILIGRIVTEDAEVLGSTPMRVVLVERAAELRSTLQGMATTDGDGRFRLGFDLPKDKELESAELRIFVGDEVAGERRATVTVPNPRLGQIDLGDILVAIPDLLAAGRVVDGEGNGLQGVEVQVGLRSEPRAGEDRLPGSMTASLASSYSDADGHFSMRGRTEAATLAMRLSKVGFGPLSLDLQRGDPGIQVQMHASAIVKGTFLVDAPGSLEGLEARLVVGGWSVHGFAIPRDGRFGVAVRAGVYDLVVNSYLFGESEIFQRRGILLREGETLDLGGLKIVEAPRRVTLQFESGSGEVIADGSTFMRFTSPEPEGSRPLRRDAARVGRIKNAQIAVSLPALPCEVELIVSGYRPKTLVIDALVQRVLLQPGLEVHLQVSGLGKLGPDDVLMLALRPEAADKWNRDLLGFLDLERGEITLNVSRPGRHAVSVFAVDRSKSGGWQDIVEQKIVPIVDVQDIEGRQSFPIELDGDAIRAKFAERRR